MPWTPADAAKKNHKIADNPRLQQLWVEVANSSLEKHGDEQRAIREAHSVVDNQLGRQRVAKETKT